MSDLFVVLEHNQAGGLPRIADDDVYLSLEEAAEQARILRMMAIPRRDRYTVARLDLLDEDDQ